MSKKKLFDELLEDIQKPKKTEKQEPVKPETQEYKNNKAQEKGKPEIQEHKNTSIQKNVSSEKNKPEYRDTEIRKTMITKTQEVVNTENKETGDKETQGPVNKENSKTWNEQKTVNTGKREPVEKKTFDFPSSVAKRLKIAAALMDQYEREIVIEAVNRYLDQLGVPNDLPFKKK